MALSTVNKPVRLFKSTNGVLVSLMDFMFIMDEYKGQLIDHSPLELVKDPPSS